MANKLTTNPIQLDTAGTVFAKNIPYVIKKVSYQAAADDNDVLLSDGDGNIIWEGKAGDVSVTGYNIQADLSYVGKNGLVLTTIDGGRLLLYV